MWLLDKMLRKLVRKGEPIVTNAVKDEVVLLYDERFFGMRQFYPNGAGAALRHGGLVNWQLQYVKPSRRTDDLGLERSLHAIEEAPEWRHGRAAG